MVYKERERFRSIQKLNCFISQPGKGRGKKKEKEEPKIKKDYDPEDPDKPYGCECEFIIADLIYMKMKNIRKNKFLKSLAISYRRFSLTDNVTRGANLLHFC